MKKIIFILGLFFSSNIYATDTSLTNKPQHFINPIFNQPLKPLSRTAGWAYLTPTSVKFSAPSDKNLIDATGQCRLIENTKDFIKLFCHMKWRKDEYSSMVMFSGNYTTDWYCTYDIKKLFFKTCLDIEETIYEIQDEHIKKISSAHYCVTPIDNSKSD